MTTEDDAKTKWCPLSRTVEQGTAPVTFNRVQEGAATVVYMPPGTRCWGSLCMAWRWSKGTEAFYVTDDGPPKRRGYCGAFGEP